MDGTKGVNPVQRGWRFEAGTASRELLELDKKLPFGHAGGRSDIRGSVTVNVEPLPSSLWIRIVPP